MYSSMSKVSNPDQPIRLCLVADQLILRESLAAMFDQQCDFNVVAQCCVSEAAVRLGTFDVADVALLDLSADRERVFHLVSKLHEAAFKRHVVIMAASISDSDAVRLAAHGVRGVFCKAHPPELLMQCIRKVAAGEVWFDQPLLNAFLKAFMEAMKNQRQEEFTERERELMRYVVRGWGNKEIAAVIGVEESAVKASFHRMFKRLGVHTRGQLVRIALERFGDEFGERLSIKADSVFSGR